MRRSISRLTVFSTCAVAFLLSSCGEKGDTVPKTGATLTGTVKYGDEPIHFALIIVQSQNGSATGNIGEDGTYRVDNVPLGEVTVSVNTDAGQGDFQTYAMSGKAKSSGKKFTAAPKKYHDPGTTTLKTTINAGMNTYEIKIPR